MEWLSHSNRQTPAHPPLKCSTIGLPPLAYPFKMTLLSQFRAAPNLLTLARLFIIPFLVIAILDGRYTLAFSLFVLAGFSDGFDGLLARMLSQRTRLGEYLDPIADKLLLSTLFLVLTHMNLVPRYVTVLVFSRDFGILLISTLLFATGALRDFRPSLLGKLNTVVQIIGLTTVLVEQVWPSIDPSRSLRLGLFRSIAILAPLSAAQYAWIVFRRISAPQPETV
jgi:cardiolipin synthase (CMP-forming)